MAAGCCLLRGSASSTRVSCQRRWSIRFDVLPHLARPVGGNRLHLTTFAAWQSRKGDIRCHAETSPLIPANSRDRLNISRKATRAGACQSTRPSDAPGRQSTKKQGEARNPGVVEANRKTMHPPARVESSAARHPQPGRKRRARLRQRKQRQRGDGKLHATSRERGARNDRSLLSQT